MTPIIKFLFGGLTIRAAYDPNGENPIKLAKTVNNSDIKIYINWDFQ